jgi:hypothetical protein
MKKRIETSKLILLVSYSIAIMLTILCIIGTFKQIDISDLKEITIVSWGEVTAANSFYYIKSRTENKLKIYKSFSKDVREQIDLNQIIN